ncbi:MAG: alpha/beta hydrolase [Maricaulis sp.]|jgi:pimeloyl-ACP methyl ester carboxylesterase|nr:alpha/beta hydrolase [Maricaulis sp.]
MEIEISTALIVASLAVTVLVGLLAAMLIGAMITKRIARQFPPGSEWLSVGGIKLHFRRTGITDQDPTNPVILVLHGAASNLEEPYAAFSDSLAGSDVIWLDRPGLGWSERPADGRWSPQREAALIAHFLDALGVKTAIVIGHSWGGAIAMRLAIDHPDRVHGLVLIAPPLCAWIGDPAWFNPASFWPLIGPFITRIFVPLTGEKALERGAISAFHPEKVPANYLHASSLPLLLRPSVWRANAADMRDVNRHLEQQEKYYIDIEQPTVIIAGKADTVVWTHRHSGLVSKHMKNAELRLIPGAGHNPHYQHGAAIAQAVIDVRQGVDTVSAE